AVGGFRFFTLCGSERYNITGKRTVFPAARLITMITSDFQRGIFVFVRGFAFTRSYTHPYLVDTLTDQVFVLRDAPRRGGDYPSVEVVASGIDPVELVQMAKEQVQGRFRLCYLLPSGESETIKRAAFKASGYRLMTTEELFIHRLTGMESAPPPFPIVRVTSEEDAARLNKANGKRLILPEPLQENPAPIRQYIAVDGEKPVGWVASVVVGHSTWCSTMYVAPEHRRKGIARSLLMRMLRDDRENGATANYLL